MHFNDEGDIYATILENLITGHTLHDQAKCCPSREQLEAGHLPTKSKFCLSDGPTECCNTTEFSYALIRKILIVTGRCVPPIKCQIVLKSKYQRC